LKKHFERIIAISENVKEVDLKLLCSLGFRTDVSINELNDAQSSVLSLLISIQQATHAKSPTPKDMKLLNSVDDSKQKEKKRQIGQVGVKESYQ
jgi:hypothetical protein